ncbi:hypothetical protein RJ40_02095 [Methanofollis aquaemaris]|uniref:LURP-one-related family protein n=1 Tax=Methanofollis aquaemaris TaxID=126734 RepID=A0A8A3S434_9EURY|nr:LURP-one-related family protein [Methanofollis aquaemaris]QSZ66374.1 hypothetical protein RJ40_02095 [Methanofollis aquaemaris]
MREKLVSIGDDYFIEDDAGARAFYVDGKALRLRDTLVFRTVAGEERYTIREKVLRVRETMEIYRGDEVAATVKKALVSPLRHRWTVEIAGGPDLTVQGNILDHEYQIKRGREQVAEVSRKWFRVRDTYGVEVAPGEDAALFLAVTAALDLMQ